MKKFYESLYNGFSACYEIEEVFYHEKTKHQELLIFKNPIFGRIMALDGIIQTTEKDEFIYHEMFAHVPLFTHVNPKKVLIVGGGDGGLLREVCKHKSIESITMVEIDLGVVELSKEYLPNHSRGSFDDPRLNLVIADGLDFVKQCQEKYDVILSDSTDPIGPGAALFAEDYYKNAAKCLKDEGILVTQNGVSFLQTEELSCTYLRMHPHFSQVKFYQADVPTYVAGNMNYAWAQKNNVVMPSEDVLNNRIIKSGIVTNYFNKDLFFSSFSLPNYVKNVLGESINA